MQRLLWTKELVRFACAFTMGVVFGVYYVSVCNRTPPIAEVSTTASKAGLHTGEELASITINTQTRCEESGPTIAENVAKTFITAEYNGGLGNLMFQFASAYGIAISVGRQVHTFESSELLSIFPRIREHVYVTAKKEDVVNQKVLLDPKHCAYAPSVVQEARAAANWSLSGYFQSYHYFEKVNEQIRSLFTFRDDLLLDADRQIALARDAFLTSNNKSMQDYDQLTYVGMHVRLGDILTDHFVQFGYQIATPDYLRRAVAYFSAKYRSPRKALLLLVFTEASGVEWCQKEVLSLPVQADYVTIISNSRRELDMAVLSRLNATIMSVGSYGWWSAYLANGETFYYGYPYKAQSRLAEQFNLQDYYPPEWRLFF